MARLLVFWLAVYGWGSLARNLFKKSEWKLPWHLAGLLAFILFSFFLSLLGLFHRPVLAAIIVLGAVAGAVRLFRLRNSWKSVNLKNAGAIVLAVLALFFTLSNFFRASIPHTNPDALTTYAVQPDRWLHQGRISYLDEIVFSAFPLSGEILASWPASLSTSRTDQLSLLQVFQMSMLLAGCYAAWQYLKRKRVASFLIIVIACMSVSMLSGWASLPKIEMTVLYFATLALCGIYRQYLDGGNSFDPLPFLAMGMALATKLTAWVALPSFLVIALVQSENRRIKRMILWSLLLLVPPSVFAVRSYINTGTPFYPYSDSFMAADAEHHLPPVPAIESLAHQNAAPNDLLVNRSPQPLPRNIAGLAESWGLPALVFLLGVVSLAYRKRLSEAIVPLISVILYLLIASILFNPTWWGAKYAFLLSPFLAYAGVLWSDGLIKPVISIFIFVIVLLVSSSVIPRLQFSSGFIGSPYPLDFRPPNIVAVRALHEWCNENLPPGSRLLSLWKRERYFSDNPVVVLENNPFGRMMLLADDLQDELDLLRQMDVDYIYFQNDDTMPGNLEDDLQILHSDRLQRIADISGFTLMKINY